MSAVRRIAIIILAFALAAACFGTVCFAAENEYSYDTRYAGFLGRGLIHEERFADRQILYGIDVSSHQNEVDMKAVAQAGCEFVFVRVGYRGYETGKIVEDKYAEQNIRGALENGMLVGVYIFSQAITVEEGIEEADYVVDLLDRYQLGPANIMLPVVYDVEYPYEDGKPVGRLYEARLSIRTRTDIAKAFLDRVAEVGYVPCLYGSRSAFNSNGKGYMGEFNDVYPIWLAAYTQKKKSGYDGPYEFWQYSSFGKVPGIDGETDLDVWYFDPSARTGWTWTDRGVRYLDAASNKYLAGWQTVDGRRYCFGQDTIMLTGWQEMGGNRYYFGESGVVRTGWQEIDGSRYNFVEDGALRTGWFDDEDGSRYYLGEDGVMQRGWQTVGGKKYCFGTDGVMLRGWQTVDEEYYCFGEDGVPLTGKQKVGSATYRFDDDGKLVWGAVKTRDFEYGPRKTILVTPWKKYQIGK